jgi:hypothetical protein
MRNRAEQNLLLLSLIRFLAVESRVFSGVDLVQNKSHRGTSHENGA